MPAPARCCCSCCGGSRKGRDACEEPKIRCNGRRLRSSRHLKAPLAARVRLRPTRRATVRQPARLRTRPSAVLVISNLSGPSMRTSSPTTSTVSGEMPSSSPSYGATSVDWRSRSSGVRRWCWDLLI